MKKKGERNYEKELDVIIRGAFDLAYQPILEYSHKAVWNTSTPEGRQGLEDWTNNGQETIDIDHEVIEQKKLNC